MKQVARYEANDGSVWKTASAAERRDEEHAHIQRIMLPLGEPLKDDGCAYANGAGYVQHDRAVVRHVADGILAACAERNEIVAKWIKDRKHVDPVTGQLGQHLWGWVGRVMDGYGPWDRAASRLYQIDAQGREWGQIYYRINPHEAKSQECILDRTTGGPA